MERHIDNGLVYSSIKFYVFPLSNTNLGFNPKRAGLFCLFQVRGGGADLGRGATKNSEIWHVRRVSQYERADEIAILKIKAFFN